MERICLVEDAPDIVQMLRAFLQQEGFSVCHAVGQQGALALLAQDAVDLLLVDISLADGNGFAVCSAAKDKNLPVVFLTASGDEYSVVAGLDMGADDYVAKPFGMMELISRIKALMRRTAANGKNDEYTADGLYVCPSKHIVKANGKEVVLTYKEFELLCLLISNKGTVFNRDQILQRIWGFEFDGENRTVDVHIRTLRTKLGECGALIETVRGIGYKIGG